MRFALGILPLILLAAAFACGFALGRRGNSRHQARNDAPDANRPSMPADLHGPGLYPGQRPRAPGKSSLLTGAKR